MKLSAGGSATALPRLPWRRMPSLARLVGAVAALLVVVAPVEAAGAESRAALPHTPEALAAAEEAVSHGPRRRQQLRGGEAAAGEDDASSSHSGRVVLMRRHFKRRSAAASRSSLRRHATAGAVAKGKPKAICIDSPSDWRSKTKSTCTDYLHFNWCTQSGDYGTAWGDNGDFKDWASIDGTPADEACCACGGGSQVHVSIEGAGQEKCASGEAIMDVATCEAAAKSFGATFTAAAAWPEGHPRGCHMDDRRSSVWLNTDPAGVGQDEFSLLCAEEEDDEDDEDDEDKN